MVLFKVANVRTGSGSDTQKENEGASLTTVLETPVLRVELALLILLCTDAMRSDLIATFDPDKTHDTTSATAPAPTPSKATSPPIPNLIDFEAPRDEASMAAERAQRMRKEEVESTQMQALRRSALTFFDKWRAGVMHRICEVLCLRGEVVRQAKAKRKQTTSENERAKQGNSLLIDFDGDPFDEQPQKDETKKFGFYDVIENKIRAFEEEKRVLILHCVLLLLLSLEHYPAQSRVLLLRLAGSLGIEVDVLNEHEKSVAQGLLASAASQMDAEGSTKRQAATDSAASKWKIGLAAVGGAVLIGVTGGLAAPLLAAGVGTVMGGLGLGAVSGLLGTLAGSSVLVGSLFGAYGGRMTGGLMKKYAQEVQDFEFIPVQDPDRPSAQQSQKWSEDLDARDPAKREQHRLRVTIGVSGWLNSPSDVNKPWEIIDPTGTEPFALRFELDSMLRLGNSLDDVLFSYAWDGVTYTVVSRTLLGALYAGLWPLGLVKVASVLDNPFSVALARADKAGKVLARALIDKVQGERPVTLIGYSIGARVLYTCLVQLAEQHAFGLIESVILMGAPVPSDSLSWRKIRSIVSSRVLNVYSTEDYILAFLYRSTKLQMGVAGLQAVEGISGIENVNMSALVSGHDRYRYLVGTILTKTGFGDVAFNKVAEQERALEVMERKKKQVREHVKRHNRDEKKPDPSSQGAVEMIVVRDNTQNVADPINNTPTRPEIERATSLPVQRPFIQHRSGQQPQIRRPTTVPTVPGMMAYQPPPPSPPPPAMDPLSGNIPLETTPEPNASSSVVATASSTTFAKSPRRQQPANLAPTSRAAPSHHLAFNTASLNYNNQVQGEEQEHGFKIQMRDIDNQKFSPPLEEMLELRGSVPSSSGPTPEAETLPHTPSMLEMGITHITETPASILPRSQTTRDMMAKPQATVSVASVDIEDHSEIESDDEVSSEFGELSMVEPTPLEEGDFGLM